MNIHVNMKRFSSVPYKSFSLNCTSFGIIRVIFNYLFSVYKSRKVYRLPLYGAYSFNLTYLYLNDMKKRKKTATKIIANITKDSFLSKKKKKHTGHLLISYKKYATTNIFL